MNRNTYIDNNNLDDALDNYLSNINTIGTENISTYFARDRITRKAIFAKVCDPTYNASAMDGVAVVAEKTIGASEVNHIVIHNGDFEYVNTGGVIHYPYDSVIMIENVIVNGNDIEIFAPTHPWQNIRAIGETVVATEMILPSFRKIRSIDIGAILASGNETITVSKKPRVGIIPTGSEMVEHVNELKIGKLIESNTRVFASLIEEYGGIPNRYNIVSDDVELLKKAIAKGVEENDILIINAGSSAGSKDYTKSIIAELGSVLYHGLAIKPGKPTILGLINGKPVIGVPGYPVSAYLVMDKVVQRVIEKMLGVSRFDRTSVTATLTKRIVSSLKNEEFIRVALGYVEHKFYATPLERGAAQSMSMIKADGIITVKKNSEGIEEGETVEVELFRSLNQIKQNLVIVGSHDVAIDVIGDIIPVVSAHVGSMGGIFAMLSGSNHIAPIHLLDEATGEYNVPFVKKYFSEGKMALIRGLGRTQGIMITKDNADKIHSIEDLRNGKFSFANRQNGAGTRLLFDYLLKKHGVSKEEVRGYDKEFTTHLAVASAVKNGIADMGMGVLSASKIMGLEFIPVGTEHYDFLVPQALLSDARVQNFIFTIKSEDFRNRMESIGGYTFDDIGEVTLI